MEINKRNRQRNLRFLFCFISIYLISSSILLGQVNLVLNGNLEVYDTCPNNPGQIEYALPWFQPNTAGSSTDYFNSCSSSFSVPNNIPGFQIAHSGNGYAGVGIISSATDSAFSPHGREYLEGTLAQQLVGGQKYCVSMYVSLANNAGLSSSIGIYFSQDSLLSTGFDVLTVTPQVEQLDPISIEDTLNWTLLKWEYIASGGEKFLTIGSFWTYPNVNYDCIISACTGAYYYIDDVSVVELPDINAGPDALIMVGDTADLIGNITQQWSGMQFEWVPHNGLSDPFSLTPFATPTVTTTYTLTVNCSTCNVPCLSDLIDSMTVFVEPISPPQTFYFHVPTLLYSDQFFQIDSLVSGTRVRLYDVRGRKIFESDNYANDFPMINLNGANYVYEIMLPDERIFTGKFCVVKR